MDIITTAAGWLFLLRWLHFLAGITWIGILYYFNFIQTPFFGSPLGGDAKSPMVRGLVPNALWWFRWGAMFTFLSGWTIVLLNLHLGAQALSGPWIAQIVTGGLMGTLMWANVWFVIWPAQKVVIQSTEQVAGGGQAIPEAAARGARAGLASRVNTLFSIPMLFMMGSASHFTFVAGSSLAWWVCVLVIVTAVEAQALIGPGLPTQKPLATVKGTIHAGLMISLLVYVVGCLVG
jgi:uncharacterized membrane protein